MNPLNLALMNAQITERLEDLEKQAEEHRQQLQCIDPEQWIQDTLEAAARSHPER